MKRASSSGGRTPTRRTHHGRQRNHAPAHSTASRPAAPAHTPAPAASRPVEQVHRVTVRRAAGTGAHAGHTAPASHRNAARAIVKASAASAGSGQAAKLVLGGAFQQEVDVLRGQLGTLSYASVWTAAKAPRFTGVYGALLEGFQAGDQLIKAFAHVNHGAAALRDGNFIGLALVRAHKPITFTARR